MRPASMRMLSTAEAFPALLIVILYYARRYGSTARRRAPSETAVESPNVGTKLQTLTRLSETTAGILSRRAVATRPRSAS